MGRLGALTSLVHTHDGTTHTHEHADGHGHAHGHAHEHGGEAAVLGAVPVLDIGGDVGAVLVQLGGPTPSGELEMCPTGARGARFHTGVHERHGAWIAVFPEVHTGRYDVLDDDLRVVASVDVVGGEVAELELATVHVH